MIDEGKKVFEQAGQSVRKKGFHVSQNEYLPPIGKMKGTRRYG